MIKRIRDNFFGQKLNVKFTIIMVVMVMLPIIVLMLIWQHNMRTATIEDHIDYSHYTIERYVEQINNKIASINMVTQVFKKDSALISMLDKNNNGNEISLDELREFKETEITALERLVNNNLVLYGVRVYANNDSIQEMMPILYNKSRMEKQLWKQEDFTEGWYYGYEDLIFAKYANSNNNELIALLTPIYDNYGRELGTIEAAMKMDEMFPDLYKEKGTEGSFVMSQDGEICFGSNPCNLSKSSAKKIAQKVTLEEGEKFLTKYIVHQDRNLVVSRYNINELGVSYIFIRDITLNMKKITVRQLKFFLIFAILTVLMACLINIVVKLLLKKMYGILVSIHEVQNGNLEVHFDDSGKDEIADLGCQINKMLERIRKLMEESIQREVLVKNSEIKALQNQINAHFIYNVLESIKMMAEIDERYEISDAITSLGELLRYSMKWVRGNVSVGEELAYIENYIQLINLRYSFEIHLVIKMPEFLYKQEIPKMSLQPIIENAIVHGIEEQAEEATIYIKGFEVGEDYQIEITDSGQGMNKEQVEQLIRKIHGEIESSGGSGNGIGLKNVQNRIQLSFGEKYGLHVISKEKCYTKIIILFPINMRSNVRGGTESENVISR